MWAIPKIESIVINNIIIINPPINLRNVLTFSKDDSWYSEALPFIRFKCIDGKECVWNFKSDEDRNNEYISLLLKIENKV